MKLLTLNVNTAVLILLVSAFLSPAIRGQQLETIRNLKSPAWNEYVGKTITLEGIFACDPLPILVTDPFVLFTNTPLHDQEYVLLVGEKAEDIDPQKYGGAHLRLEGLVVTDLDSKKYRGDRVGLQVISYKKLKRSQPYRPQPVELKAPVGTPSPHRYAILFGGGRQPASNHVRYWNDLKFLYTTLIGKYGYTDDTITVLYAEGRGLDNGMTVDYAATKANLKRVFELLRTKTTEEDFIFFYTTGQGEGFYKDDPLRKYERGGQVDRNGDEGGRIEERDYNIDLNRDGDKEDTVTWDEALSTWGDSMLDDAIVEMLEGHTYHRMLIVMDQSFGGGIIGDLFRRYIAAGKSEANKIGIAPAGAFGVSLCMRPRCEYDEYSYHFTCALNEADPIGRKVKSDRNGDGRVTIQEAYAYAEERCKYGRHIKIVMGPGGLDEETSLR